MGSRAANRLPTLHTCHPTHSAFQWSTAAKVQTQPQQHLFGDLLRRTVVGEVKFKL